MHTIIKIVVLVIVLLMFLRLFLPKSDIYEYFSESVINAYDNSGTVLYSKKDTDVDYMNIVNNRIILSELMVMNRCIEFTAGSIETTIDSIRGEFYISDKISIKYKDFTDIQTTLATRLKELYVNSKIDKFLGPIYVLITQYPKRLNVSSNCTVQPIPLKDNTDGSFSPINMVGTSITECSIDSQIDAELFILMPSHKHTGDSNKVGEPNNKTWNSIKASMSILLEQNSKVIDTRSTNSKCFTTCGNVANNRAYICGARNRPETDTTSYNSIVLNSPINNKDAGFTKVDIANLYVIDTNVMNGLVCPSITGGCLSRGISVEPIPLKDGTLSAEITTQEYVSDLTDMTPAEEICYSKRHGIRGDSNTLRQHWYNIGSKMEYIKKCSPDVLPITDEQLQCYMNEEAHKLGRPITETEARMSYFDKYQRGETITIRCPDQMDDTLADCYKNRYRLDMGIDEIKEQWRKKGFYEGKTNSCHLQEEEKDQFYMTLTPEEAHCYQKNTDSLRNNIDLTVPQLRNIWLEESGTKDKTCKTVPEMTDEEADCYINRNTDLRGKDPKTHWKEFGFYENRSKSCSDGVYKSLTKEEAACYKRRTDSLRETNITDEELNNLYFDGSLEGKDKTCIDIPKLTDREKGCYLNKNRVQLEIDRKNGIDINDVQKHYEERGAYIGLTPDCENGRYVTIDNSEAICYKNNNFLNMPTLQEVKNHWYDTGFVRKLSKQCPNIPHGERCYTDENSLKNCKYCSGNVSTEHGVGVRYCGYYRECQRCNNAGHCRSVCPIRDENNHKCGHGTNNCHCRRVRDRSMCGKDDIL